MVGSEVSPDRRPDDRGCRPDGFRSAYPYHRDGTCPRNGRRGEDGIIVKIVFHIFMFLQLRCPFYSTSCRTIIRNCPEIFPENPSNSAGLPENAPGEWPVTYFRRANLRFFTTISRIRTAGHRNFIISRHSKGQNPRTDDVRSVFNTYKPPHRTL